MQYRAFGPDDWKISEIGLGTYAIGGYWGPTDDEESRKVIEEAYNLGVNFFDTADIYGRGKAEKLIGEVLVNNGLREEIYIATKAGYDFYTVPGKMPKNFDPQHLDFALNKSLERLNTDYVDLFQLHSASVENMQDDSVLKFLESAKKDGRVKLVGVSVYGLPGVQEAVTHNVFNSVQFIVNMLADQENIRRMLELCASENVSVIAREPLEQSLLTGKYSIENINETFPKDDHRSVKWTREYLEVELPRVYELSAKFVNDNCTLPQAALRYALSFPGVATVIPGARKLSQLRENVAASNMERFTEEDMRYIASV